MVLKFFDEKPRYIGKVVLIEEYDGVVHSQVYAARNFHRFFLEIDTVPFPVMVDRISGWDYKYISDLKVGDEFLLDRIDSEDEYHFRVSINDYPYYTEFIEYKLFGINK